MVDALDQDPAALIGDQRADVPAHMAAEVRKAPYSSSLIDVLGGASGVGVVVISSPIVRAGRCGRLAGQTTSRCGRPGAGPGESRVKCSAADDLVAFRFGQTGEQAGQGARAGGLAAVGANGGPLHRGPQ
ncbi:hypothetical protein [Streptomyces zhihengii]|uniref:Uncharacterized protein n=1 Tax=Streptomyces zhihengii TaxID=1818004 RepID=A0ABS2V2R7_9ACTN|nr:hypothetical protein [Streptomyces zhihengii]MBM9623978.1 hypothetical protein [Streptomyces zhihengii]